MGISINTVTHGISRQGAEAFRQQIHQEAIEETKQQLSKIDSITAAIESAWQGKAASNFMANFRTKIDHVKDDLDGIDAELTSELDNIQNDMIQQDEEMVPLEK